MADVMACGVCGADWPPGSVFCRVCGTSVAQVEPVPKATIADAAPTAVEPVERGVDDVPVCRQCGATSPRGAQRCLSCFAALDNLPAVAEPVSVSLTFPWGARTLGEGDRLLVGRSYESELCGQLDAFPDISRRHAQLEVRAGALLVRDLGSMNGTFRNDNRLAPDTDQVVAPGDRVRFGDRVVAVLGPNGAE